jgi:hypothetical protein
MPTKRKMRTLLEHVGFHVEDVESFNVWLQPFHDYRVLPALGRVRRAMSRPAAGTPAPGRGPSGFQRLYSAAVIPLARVLAAPDRIGSMLGLGGSASFVARKGTVGARGAVVD